MKLLILILLPFSLMGQCDSIKMDTDKFTKMKSAEIVLDGGIMKAKRYFGMKSLMTSGLYLQFDTITTYFNSASQGTQYVMLLLEDGRTLNSTGNISITQINKGDAGYLWSVLVTLSPGDASKLKKLKATDVRFGPVDYHIKNPDDLVSALNCLSNYTP